MLNLFKQKMVRVIIKQQNIIKTKIDKTSKHFPSPIREWKDSIYGFNKQSVNLIPSTTKLVIKLIKSYFDLYNKRFDSKMRAKTLKFRLRRLSTNKFYVSNGGFKHTNNKVNINLYVFNRQKNNYLLTLKKWYLKTMFLKNDKLIKNNLEKKLINPKSKYFVEQYFDKKLIKTTVSHEANSINSSLFNNGIKNTVKFSNRNLNIKLIKRLNIIKNKGIQTAIDLSNDKYSLIKGLNTCLPASTSLVGVQKKTQLDKNYDTSSIFKIKNFSSYTKDFYIDLIKKSLKKIRMYFYYKQLLYINKSKFNYTYLQYLKNSLEKIYTKNVEFNIINMKKFYLNSDIATQAISNKLTKNRRKLLNYLTMFKNKIKTQKKKVYLGYIDIKNRLVKNLSNNNVFLQKDIINNLKYKDITGFKLEAKGRLTKRFAAARAVYKHKSKGGLYDIDSSFRGLSTILLKGNLKSNTQYTYLKSKTRIGSFGIKGWVSGN